MSIEWLEADANFQYELNEVIRRYPNLKKEAVYKIIQGESAFNPQAINRNTGAVGFFQFTPVTAYELGYSAQQILNMSPADQMWVYGKYLDKWKFNDKHSGLGIMQAAPARASWAPDDVVYEKDSPQWARNPGWHGSDGRITVQSINDYYDKQGT